MTTFSLYNQATPGGTINSGAGNAGTNGLHFTVNTPVVFDGIWHYSPGTSTQLPTTIGVYTITTLGTSGTLLHSETPTWSGAAGSGWVFAKFVNPPVLLPGTGYMAAQFRNDATNEWFVLYASTWPVTSGPITAPQDESTSALSQGWFNAPNTVMAFPTQQVAGDNFGMDVQVTIPVPLPKTPVRNRAKATKSRTTASKTLTPTVAPTPSPFNPPVKAVKGEAAARKSTSRASKGSVVVPGPVSPFTPPVKATRGKPADRKGRTTKASPVASVQAGAVLQTASITIAAHTLGPVFAGGSTLATANEIETGHTFTPATATPLSTASLTTTARTLTTHANVGLQLAHSTITAWTVTPTHPTPTNVNLLTATTHVTSYPITRQNVVFVDLLAARARVAVPRVGPPNPLIMTVTPGAGVDDFGNPYSAGFHIYSGTTNGSRVSLQSTNSTYGAQPTIEYTPASTTNVTLSPQTFGYSNAAGAANQQTWIIHSSGKTNGKDDAAIQLVGQSGDSTNDATMIFEFGGTTTATLKKNANFTLQNATTPQVIFIPASAAHLTTNPFVSATLNATGAGEQILMVVSSGKESGNADAALQLFSAGANGVATATAVIEFGGATGLTVTSTGISAPNFSGSYAGSQSVSGWPIAAGSGTVGPAQLSSGLSNALNSIYNAGHAAGIW